MPEEGGTEGNSDNERCKLEGKTGSLGRNGKKMVGDVYEL
jgi:hypothetical protein